MTWAELHEVWNERDTRYSMRKINAHAAPVTDNEHDAIVTWRRIEAEQLDSREQDLGAASSAVMDCATDEGLSMTLPYLSMMRGDTTQFAYTVTNDGQPIDLGNAELTWTAVPLPWANDATGSIVKTLDDGITIIDEEDGTIVIQMDAADTEDLTFQWSCRRHSYTWDLQVVDDYEQTMTRGRGILYVHRDITVEEPL